MIKIIVNLFYWSAIISMMAFAMDALFADMPDENSPEKYKFIFGGTIVLILVVLDFLR